MTNSISVVPGIDMSRDVRRQNRNRLTKDWLRQYLTSHPLKDFRSLMVSGGTYLNGRECIRHDLMLAVHDPNTLRLVAVVEFVTNDNHDLGFEAVVR